MLLIVGLMGIALTAALLLGPPDGTDDAPCDASADVDRAAPERDLANPDPAIDAAFETALDAAVGGTPLPDPAADPSPDPIDAGPPHHPGDRSDLPLFQRLVLRDGAILGGSGADRPDGGAGTDPPDGGTGGADDDVVAAGRADGATGDEGAERLGDGGRDAAPEPGRADVPFGEAALADLPRILDFEPGLDVLEVDPGDAGPDAEVTVTATADGVVLALDGAPVAWLPQAIDPGDVRVLRAS